MLSHHKRMNSKFLLIFILLVILLMTTLAAPHIHCAGLPEGLCNLQAGAGLMNDVAFDDGFHQFYRK
ncbi:hypothetical protein AB6A40_003078 [Gnathostoma spinigerum]|uniref:Uncharacterized protein n=1 Tax=Gnathostoma spinigerum TaxID=75299 RepID=A0ABD6EGA6_9BILA